MGIKIRQTDFIDDKNVVLSQFKNINNSFSK